jgi:hypothetical protein
MLQIAFWGNLSYMPKPKATKPPSELDLLDDTAPAGPYPHQVDDCALRLLCLATIDQAMRDVRNGREGSMYARHWLRTSGRRWLTWLGVARRGGDGRAEVIFEPDDCVPLLMEEEGGQDGSSWPE